MSLIDRRALLKASASMVSAALVGGAAGRAAPARADAAPLDSPAPTGVPPFRAAVFRVPVLVPPSIGELPAVRQHNADAMVAAIEDAMRGAVKPKLLVFPILQYTSSMRSVSGIPMSAVAVDLTSKPLEEGIYGPVIAACRRHDCYVVTTTPEKTLQMPNVFFHTGFIMGPKGLVLRSPKAQAYSAPDVTSLRDIAADYQRLFGRAAVFPVVQTPIGRLGCFVEAEAEVMEAARLLASKGAEIIVHPSVEKEEVPWRAIKQATAYECHVFLLTATTSRNILASDPAGQWTYGASTIIGPDGKLLAEIEGHQEGAAAAIKPAGLQ